VQLHALVTAAWFGSGLIAEDLRAGAHQLWFARPLSRFAYVLARFSTVALFSAFAVLVPGLVICLVATINSPDYSFLRDEGDVIWRTIVYSSLWIATTGLVALAVSSLVRKRTWALVGFFAVFLVPHACGLILGELASRAWRVLSPLLSLRSLSEEVLAIDRRGMQVPGNLDWWGVAAVLALALSVLAWRIRRVEVVA